ncbi:LCP family glycopolymer transferase [Cellulomonas edaphi]|uniref:LCP family protein n=1 Tax=Cellulomonas edaphi TaxID=3053468 RepID=A0ABT7S4R4_9CELL|nr:LCP family protein [Cellulomons edaphi]MDM7830603.1 LCP family protein [Cellulomons edaphi]
MSPPEAVPPTAVASRFHVLLVGATNVGDSLAAERLLRARLGADSAVTVTSAGIHATPGDPVPEHLSELLAREGVAVDGHHAQELDAAMVESADLVLTATRDERAAVVRRVPAAVRRTFTLSEMARLATSLGPSALPEGDAAARLAALARVAPAQRGARPVAEDDDIPFPAAAGPRGYEESLDQVRAAVDGIVWTVLSPPDEPGPPPAPPRRPEPPPRSPSHRGRNIAIAVVGSLVLLIVVAMAGALVVVGALDNRLERFPNPIPAADRPPPFTPAEVGGPVPVNILVLGSTDDVRTKGDQDWAEAAAQTDIVMLAHVSADRSSVQVIAMPPDLAADVPGSGPGTLRSAFAEGGPTGAVQTVERLTNVRLDHVALTDSDTFAQVTDELGGVEVDLDADVVIDGREVSAGPQVLTGEEALAWVRADGVDDVTGARRSAVWLRAILDRLGDDDVRRNPVTWLRLLRVVSGSVAVDQAFDRSELVGLLTSVRNVGPGEVRVVPVRTKVVTTGDSAATVPEAAPFAALIDALRTDTLDAQPAAPIS